MCGIWDRAPDTVRQARRQHRTTAETGLGVLGSWGGSRPYRKGTGECEPTTTEQEGGRKAEPWAERRADGAWYLIPAAPPSLLGRLVGACPGHWVLDSTPSHRTALSLGTASYL